MYNLCAHSYSYPLALHIIIARIAFLCFELFNFQLAKIDSTRQELNVNPIIMVFPSIFP